MLRTSETTEGPPTVESIAVLSRPTRLILTHPVLLKATKAYPPRSLPLNGSTLHSSFSDTKPLPQGPSPISALLLPTNVDPPTLIHPALLTALRHAPRTLFPRPTYPVTSKATPKHNLTNLQQCPCKSFSAS
ncbi:hypothetical protein RRG08_057429 [Elysia crispata]|uniref:Uncharacterized protein n=1 Tax=Elysia crispata TaxID=231223 RepID=A0AAE0YCY6_9GAST|nr:hypothetical protein RRG08_057429 [Elysia crispata]